MLNPTDSKISNILTEAIKSNYLPVATNIMQMIWLNNTLIALAALLTRLAAAWPQAPR